MYGIVQVDEQRCVCFVFHERSISMLYRPFLIFMEDSPADPGGIGTGGNGDE